MITRSDLIPYLQAYRLLSAKIDTSVEEIAAWVFLGKAKGGMDAYLNPNMFGAYESPPEKFYFSQHEQELDYAGLLTRAWFLLDDIKNFDPQLKDRYITGKELLKRWESIPGMSTDRFIVLKIEESQLVDLHPTFGGTSAGSIALDGYPPLRNGLFSLSEILSIEESELGSDTAESLTKPGRILNSTKQINSPLQSGFQKFPSPPKRIDEWFLVIQEVYSELQSESGKSPQFQELLAKLRKDPPSEYGITHGKYRGEFAIFLDEKPLTRSTFRERWNRYTRNNKY
ncbi:MAG: hypothetical protein RL839_06580 [Gammaproteobacteria bacterium]